MSAAAATVLTGSPTERHTFHPTKSVPQDENAKIVEDLVAHGAQVGCVHFFDPTAVMPCS